MADHKWIAGNSTPMVPPMAVIAGYNSNGDVNYIGRAEHNGKRVPANIVSRKHEAYICDGDQAITVENYEYLCGARYEWIHDSDGNVPPAAVKVGYDEVSDEFLYAGRAYCQGNLRVGTIQNSHDCLYIPNNSEAIKLDDYEVLSLPEIWYDVVGSTTLPDGVVECGRDDDGDCIYVGRVIKGCDLMAAKIIPNKGGAYTSWGNKEYKTNTYQVLTGAGFKWMPGEFGSAPEGAISIGTTCYGETLYVGRASHAGILTVGKVHPSHGCLYFPAGNEEIKVESYEVLVRE